MSRVEKHNPLKDGALSRKRDMMGVDTGKAEIRELTFDTVKRDALQFGLATDVMFQMNAGKEASIFLAVWKEHPIILKAYRLWQTSHHLSKSKGFVPVGTSKRTHCILGMAENYAVVEYDLLMNCFRAGVHVPTPIGRVGNYLTMRFIGDGKEPAPQLKDVTLLSPEKVLDQVLDDYFIMYTQVHYVHGDLSKYNILWWQERPWIIDVPQGYKVDTHCDMDMAVFLLGRDIMNVLSYFETYGIYRDPEVTMRRFIGAYTPKNIESYDLTELSEML